jgi:hypothetical protein
MCLLLLLFASACRHQASPGMETTPPLETGVPGQLITLSADKTHLINTITNKPVFLTGDSPQLLMLQVSDADVDVYLADRAARGFNVLWTYPVDAVDQKNAPKNFYGNAPFDGPDFTNEDPTYWAHVDSVLKRAASYKITLVLEPGFVGLTPQSGYLNSYLISSNDVMKAYGTWLGNRYKDYNNVIWSLGGDADLSVPGLAGKISSLASGLATADRNHLITFEACRLCDPANQSSLDALATKPSWLGLNWVYNPQASVIAGCQKNYLRSSMAPPFMGEDWYELEHGLTGTDTRAEGYWEVLSGCYLGTLWGNGALWSLNSPNSDHASPSWQSQLSSVGSVSQEWMGKLMRSREHWKMVPDVEHSVVISGFGSGIATAVTARSSDGQTIISYIPNGNATTLTVDLTKISSAKQSSTVWWFNPSTGIATQIGTLSTSGIHTFTPPDSNDWVLVLDDASADLKAPGSGDL